MLIEILDQKHETYDADEWRDLEALYAGGKKFRQRIHRFLERNPEESDSRYHTRCKQAHYRSYLGPIVDYYTAWLFSDAPEVRGTDENGKAAELDDWYAQFKEDVGGDTDLVDFLTERLRDALKLQCSHWIVEFPQDTTGLPAPGTLREYKERGLGEAKLRELKREDLYDWECDEDGRVVYFVTHSQKTVRPSPMVKRDTVIETWKVYDDENITTFRIQYRKGERPPKESEAPQVGQVPHRCKQLPLVTLSIPEGLCIGSRVESAQREHFRQSAALSWVTRQCCYPMPVFHAKDEDTKDPIMGAGYWVKISIGEIFEWVSPQGVPFAVLSADIDAQREEIYRITNQMAQSVNSRNAAALAKSAESKEADSLSTKVMLEEYAKKVRAAIEETYEIISDARGDTETTFAIGGLANWSTDGPTEILTNAGLAINLRIPSRTFNTELKTKAANALLPQIDQHTRDKIRREIESGVEVDEELSDAMREANQADAEHRAKNPGATGPMMKQQPREKRAATKRPT